MIRAGWDFGPGQSDSKGEARSSIVSDDGYENDHGIGQVSSAPKAIPAIKLWTESTTASR